jgi:hypothetical protein
MCVLAAFPDGAGGMLLGVRAACEDIAVGFEIVGEPLMPLIATE